MLRYKKHVQIGPERPAYVRKQKIKRVERNGPETGFAGANVRRVEFCGVIHWTAFQKTSRCLTIDWQ